MALLQPNLGISKSLAGGTGSESLKRSWRVADA